MFLSDATVAAALRDIPSSHPILTARFPASESAVIFNFVSKVDVALGL
jgi:putative flippase GtrA